MIEKTALPSAREALIASVRPLRPYLPHLVLCGGWTLFVYRHWLVGEGPEPLLTRDIDLASPDPLPDEGKPLAECLLDAGYHREVVGLDLDPPVQRFVHGEDSELEFITPIVGDVTPATVEVQKGLVAQSLRFVELLLHDPLSIPLTPSDLTLRVSAPATYFMQKALSFSRRNRKQDKAKDLAYLFEFLHNYPDLNAELEEGIRHIVGVRHEWAGWSRKMVDNLDRYFDSLDAEGVHLVITQQPHPYGDYVSEGGREGEEEFRGLVFRTFHQAVVKLRTVPGTA